MSRIGVVGDTHEPVSRPGYLEFCLDIFDAWDVDTVVHIGDWIDWHGISFHAKEPQCPGPKDEYELAKACVKKWVDAFEHIKKKYVCIGNHDERPSRLAKTVSIPDFMLKSYSELWETPGWKWNWNHIIDDIVFKHGTGCGGIHPAWNLMNKNKMSTVIGHCLAPDTEILTPSGWTAIPNVATGQYVATMSKNKLLQWQPVRIKTTENAPLIETGFMSYTPEHRVIYETESGYIGERKGKQFRKMGEVNIIRAISNNAPRHYDLDFLRLLVWVAADGSFLNNKNWVGFHLKKERKINRLCWLLRRINIPFKKYSMDGGSTKIDIHRGYLIEICNLLTEEKVLPWSLVGVSPDEAQVILEEYANTDGCYINDSVQISCMKKQTIDVLQALLSVAGIRATTWQKDNGLWLLSACKRPVCSMHAKEESNILPRQAAFCVSVANKTIVVRRKGKVFITGNCHSRGGIKWSVNPLHRFFAVDVGCGINERAWQFAYGRDLVERPVLSCVVIIDGHPYFEMMPCSHGEKYHDSKFKKRGRK